MAVFTKDTASEMGKRSVARRRLVPFTFPPLPDDVQQSNGENAAQTAIKRQLSLVAEQITRTRNVLNDERAEWCPACERSGIAPHHRAQLLKALDALLDRQRKLLNVPDPGTRRPGREPARRSVAVSDPQPADSTPPVVLPESPQG